MSQQLSCRCGTMMFSDGEKFDCPFHEDENYKHDPPVLDIRTTVGKSRPLLRLPGEPGGGHSRVRRNCRLIRVKRVKGLKVAPPIWHLFQQIEAERRAKR